MKIVSSFFAFFVFANPVGAESFTPPVFKPNLVETTDTLNQAERSEINSKIVELRKFAHVYAAILMIDHLQGDTIEQAAEKTFRAWKIGNLKADDGLLLVIARQERRVRIEVGYGLEGEIPDIVAGRIISNRMLPLMRSGQPSLAILAALDAVLEVRNGTFDPDLVSLSNAHAPQALVDRPHKIRLNFSKPLIWWHFFVMSVGPLFVLAVSIVIGRRRIKYPFPVQPLRLPTALGARILLALLLVLYCLFGLLFSYIFADVQLQSHAVKLSGFLIAFQSVTLILPMLFVIIPALFASVARRRQLMGRLERLRSRVPPGTTAVIFGQPYRRPVKTKHPRKVHSSSSRRSRSSSSRGGRSGGGGASGRW